MTNINDCMLWGAFSKSSFTLGIRVNVDWDLGWLHIIQADLELTFALGKISLYIGGKGTVQGGLADIIGKCNVKNVHMCITVSIH